LNIEELRLDISSSESFNPKAIFNFIDEEQDGKITVEELQQYLFDNGMRDGTNESVCREIISEYDTDLDGELSYQEFLNLFLPATDERLRKLCLLKSEI
jgi:Ca2+-binding EF-hand superfamily protein